MLNINKHMDFVRPDSIDDRMIHIVGLGALGSNLAIQLTRMGFTNFVLYDFDTVDPHNIPNQAYTQDDIGKEKLVAIEEQMLKINPEVAVYLMDKWTPRMQLTDFVFLALDSIELRKQIMEEYKDSRYIKLMTDMRIGLEQAQMYCADWECDQAKSRIISTAQFKDDEVTTPRNACGSFLNILPTIQMIVSLGAMNFINYIKTGNYNYQSVIDSVQGIANSFK